MYTSEYGFHLSVIYFYKEIRQLIKTSRNFLKFTIFFRLFFISCWFFHHIFYIFIFLIIFFLAIGKEKRFLKIADCNDDTLREDIFTGRNFRIFVYKTKLIKNSQLVTGIYTLQTYGVNKKPLVKHCSYDLDSRPFLLLRYLNTEL